MPKYFYDDWFLKVTLRRSIRVDVIMHFIKKLSPDFYGLAATVLPVSKFQVTSNFIYFTTTGKITYKTSNYYMIVITVMILFLPSMKIKVTVSLCTAPSYKILFRPGGVAPIFLDLGTRGGRMISCRRRQLYFGNRAVGVHREEDCLRGRAGMGTHVAAHRLQSVLIPTHGFYLLSFTYQTS
jgi:hypothetical protein